jgi:hypothetical protein
VPAVKKPLAEVCAALSGPQQVLPARGARVEGPQDAVGGRGAGQAHPRQTAAAAAAAAAAAEAAAPRRTLDRRADRLGAGGEPLRSAAGQP